MYSCFFVVLDIFIEVIDTNVTYLWMILIEQPMYQGDSINKVTRPLTCVMFLILFKFPARSEQVEHCFLSWTLDHTAYQSYCPNINCKLAGLAKTWSNIEVHSVIRFLQLEGIS
jgi:hypothetical protein